MNTDPKKTARASMPSPVPFFLDGEVSAVVPDAHEYTYQSFSLAERGNFGRALLFELHAAIPWLLDCLFQAHMRAGGRVLDAGCGCSLFTEIRTEWPFRVVASDVDDLLASRKAESPSVHWLVGDAHPLPFRHGASTPSSRASSSSIWAIPTPPSRSSGAW